MTWPTGASAIGGMAVSADGALYVSISPASDTWANRASYQSTGNMFFASNFGSGGNLLIYNGTRWSPVSGSAAIYTLASRSANIGAAETIVAQYQIPAGMLQVSDRIRVALSMTKSGATDTGFLTFRIGAAGTTADTSLGSGSAMTAGNRGEFVIQDFRLLTNTTMQRYGANVGGSQGYVGPSVGVMPGSVAITDASANALYLSIGINSGGATDTVNLEDAQYTLIVGS